MQHIYDNRHKLTDIEKRVCEHIFIDLSHQKIYRILKCE